MKIKLVEPLLALALMGIGEVRAAPPAGSPSPAQVANPVKETELTSVHLTIEAEKRLGITTAPAERRLMKRTRLFGGELLLPGQSGTNIAALQAGATAELLRVAQAQVDADSESAKANVMLEAAKTALARAEQLLKDRAGSERSADEARTQVGLAQVALRAAEDRRRLLGPPVLESVRQPHFWVRVPVSAVDLTRLDTDDAARIGPLSGSVMTPFSTATPIAAPPSANSAAGTVDLFYQLSDRAGALRLGQRVAVRIPLREPAETLAIAWASVLYDIHGGTWVYTRTAPQTFTRRRVHVTQVVDGTAAIGGSMEPGTPIVVDGAAELFGTEFGGGK